MAFIWMVNPLINGQEGGGETEEREDFLADGTWRGQMRVRSGCLCMHAHARIYKYIRVHSAPQPVERVSKRKAMAWPVEPDG